MKELSDIELLDAYTSQRSEDAFRELATRHVDLIYSAAMRQLQNPQLAQEVTQAAFIALAGKAGQLRRQTVVAGWLHRAAHFAALKLQRSEIRRKRWEQEAATMNAPGESDQSFQELALPHVDGALAELNERDRDALVLRFLQQKSLRDVADTLGISEDAAKKRVSRALDKLRGLLARRGVAIPAAVLAVGLAQMPVTAAPASLSTAVAALVVSGTIPTATIAAKFLAWLASAKARIALAIGLLLLCALAAFLWPPRLRQPVLGAGNPAQTNNVKTSNMKIRLTSVMVDNQAKALRFYTDVLGFVMNRDLPVGNERWLTVVSPTGQGDVELLLEPMGFPAARPYQKALYDAGIPFTSFAVDDLQKEYERIAKLGGTFSVKPTNSGPASVAVVDDTCGNLIQLVQRAGAANGSEKPAVKISLARVMVKDQDQALKFYTGKLGFVKKRDLPAGETRWLTVVSPEEPQGPELLLEPLGFAPAAIFQKALFDAGIPLAAFAVDDIRMAYEQLKKSGVVFTMEPTSMGPSTLATFDDTCGNLIQIFQ